MPTDIEILIALSRLLGFGAGSYWKLNETFGDPKQILHTNSNEWPVSLSDVAAEQWRGFVTQNESSLLKKQVQKDISWCEKNDVRLLTHFDEAYPGDLRQVHRSPVLLYVWGDVDSLSMPQISIVGSRKPSISGRDTAKSIAAKLASSGFAITSGLALGIDVAAHEGALSASGTTIAVLGTGINKIYPFRHKRIAKDIIDKGGAIVSEFPLGTPAQPTNFPQRNRIISALSSGVLVVEANIKSGSLITARYALQQNREVFAVPGSIHNPLSAGCHFLIKQGATLVESCQDIVDQLEGYLANKQQELDGDPYFGDQNTEPSCGEDEKQVLELISFESLSLDELVERSGLMVAELSQLLMSLEMKGLVSNDIGLYSRNYA